MVEQLEALLPDWRVVLRKHAPRARQMLRKLLRGRVAMTPEVRHEQPGYRVRGAGDGRADTQRRAVDGGGERGVHKLWRPQENRD
jgi:hypothetical protein